MMKTLLLGASALALTATAASAQEVANPKTLNMADQYGVVIKGAQLDQVFVDANDPTKSGSKDTAAANTAAGTALDAGATEYNGPNNNRGLTGVYERNASALVSDLRRTGPGNEAGLDQNGDSNDSSIDQSKGYGGWAISNQYGDDNKSTITQSDGDSAAQGGRAINRAYVGQVSADAGTTNDTQVATINQIHEVRNGTGMHNAAVVIQGVQVSSGNTRQAGRDNVGTITQNGAGLDAIIEQGADFDGVGDSTGGNRAGILQDGSLHRAVIQQENTAVASVEQLGTGNRAYVMQDAGLNNLSRSHQTGTDNFLAVSQDNGATSLGDQIGTSNQAFVRQTGAGAWSELEQDGSDNFASVTQSADGVESQLYQLGAGNEAYVTQSYAMGSFAVTTQQGNGNFSQIKQ